MQMRQCDMSRLGGLIPMPKIEHPLSLPQRPQFINFFCLFSSPSLHLINIPVRSAGGGLHAQSRLFHFSDCPHLSMHEQPNSDNITNNSRKTWFSQNSGLVIDEVCFSYGGFISSRRERRDYSRWLVVDSFNSR